MTCNYCKNEIKSTQGYISDGEMFHLGSCYAKARPYVPRKTFEEVLVSIDGQQLLHEILIDWVPNHIKAIIVRQFNCKMQIKQERMENQE